MMLNVLFSITYYDPYVSGLTLYISRLAEALVKKGYSVSVLTMRYDKKLPEIEMIKKIQVVRANTLIKINKGFLSLDWILKSWKEVRKADVIVLDLPQFEAIVPAICAKLSNKPCIAIYQCDVILPPGGINFIVERVLRLLHIITLSLVPTIITHTKDFAIHSVVLKNFLPKILYAYPPTEEFKSKNIGVLKLKKRIGNSDIIIGIASRLSAEKGIEYVINALPIIQSKFPTKTIKIVFAGPLNPVGEEFYRKQIESLIHEKKSNIVFVGTLSREEMGSFYKIINVLVVSSINMTDSIATVQLEAMVAGVCVIATNLPGIRVPIQETGMGIIVPIKNSQKISDAIVEIYTNKKKYISPKVQAIAKEKFSMDKTINFYQQLLSSF